MPGMKEQLIRDGVAQMAQILNGRSGLDSIQIVSHGSVGALYLGSTVLDASTLGSYQSQLQAIGSSLTASGDILLYGCNVAQGDAGIAFIQALAGSTGADVAASNDVTGAGGDWVLEQTFRAALRTVPRRSRWATTSC